MTSSSLYLLMTGPEENSPLSKNGGDKVLKRKEIPHTLYSFIFLFIGSILPLLSGVMLFFRSVSSATV